MHDQIAVRFGFTGIWHALSPGGTKTICGRQISAEVIEAATDTGMSFPVSEPPPKPNMWGVVMPRPFNCGWCKRGEKPPTPPSHLVGWCSRCSMWQRIEDRSPAAPCLNETCEADAREIRNMTTLMRRSGKVEWLGLAHKHAVFPALVDIERHGFGYRWRKRFETIEILDVGEGFTIHAATEEGSFWIVRDSGTLADFCHEEEAKTMDFITLEKYEHRAGWETMVQLEVEKAKRRGDDYERRLQIWRRFEQRSRRSSSSTRRGSAS